ncbi:MAG: hypothetical protein NUV90_00540 [Candidatus Parcubacteria bacterium]|nr:hypothetical protein [Candidatus Parcubacteria bacterium]
MTITVVSILAITGAVWLVGRFLPFAVCPICAGVFLTWVGLLGARAMGYPVDLTVPAILMGGSVVGIAYQIEKRSRVSRGARMLFKALFMPAGFVAAYALLQLWWTVLFSAIAFLVVVSAWALRSPVAGPHREAGKEIEKEMKDCC